MERRFHVYLSERRRQFNKRMKKQILTKKLQLNFILFFLRIPKTLFPLFVHSFHLFWCKVQCARYCICIYIFNLRYMNFRMMLVFVDLFVFSFCVVTAAVVVAFESLKYISACVCIWSTTLHEAIIDFFTTMLKRILSELLQCDTCFNEMKWKEEEEKKKKIRIYKM